MKKQEAWTAEAVDFIHTMLSDDKTFVRQIICEEPTYIVELNHNDLYYVPPMFWRVNSVYFNDNTLHIVMEINVSDLYRLMGV